MIDLRMLRRAILLHHLRAERPWGRRLRALRERVGRRA